MTPLEIFFAVGDLEQRAPPDMKEDLNRILAGVAIWLDDLDLAEEDEAGWKPEYEKSWNMEKDICFQMRDWMSYDHLDKMRLDGTYRPRNVAEIEETWKELFPEQEWVEHEQEEPEG